MRRSTLLAAIFDFESTRQRQRDAPLFKEREEFLLAMLQRGSSKKRIRTMGAMLLHIVRLLGMETLRPVSVSEIDGAAARWVDLPAFRTRNGQQKSASLCIYVAKKWLRFHGCLLEASPRVEPDDSYVEKLVDYLQAVRGLAPETIRVYRRRVTAFLKWNRGFGRPLGLVTMNEVDHYLQAKLMNGYRPRAICGVCSALRTLFLFADAEGWNTTKVWAGIVEQT